MIYISHRGNLTGKQPERENTIEYINKALAKGYYCEVDVYVENGELLLGHDRGETPVDISYLKQDKIIAHAKSLPALGVLLNWNVHCFFHNTDDYTLTSRNWIWAYPGKPGTPIHQTIAVMPEIDDIDVTAFDGICSDYVERYKNEYDRNY